MANEFNDLIDNKFEPQNIEYGILNFEVPVMLASLLRFEITYSVFDISNIFV
jgi:hypothetical protein